MKKIEIETCIVLSAVLAHLIFIFGTALLYLLAKYFYGM